MNSHIRCFNISTDGTFSRVFGIPKLPEANHGPPNHIGPKRCLQADSILTIARQT
jgi:hypothetical protein